MKVLYICTHNRCRSILCEALTRHYAGDRIEARSAGSQPAKAVHPLTLSHLAAAGVVSDDLRSQSLDEHEDFAPDLVITVCDSAAGESCPVWFGKAIKVHWGLSDPSSVQGSEAEIADAFAQCMQTISDRVHKLAALTELESEQWLPALRALGAKA